MIIEIAILITIKLRLMQQQAEAIMFFEWESLLTKN